MRGQLNELSENGPLEQQFEVEEGSSAALKLRRMFHLTEHNTRQQMLSYCSTGFKRL